jgi:plastocyanin
MSRTQIGAVSVEKPDRPFPIQQNLAALQYPQGILNNRFMKKISTLIAAGLLAMALAGCSKVPTAEAPANPQANEPAAVAAPTDAVTQPIALTPPAVPAPIKAPEVATKSQVTAKAKITPSPAPQVVNIQYTSFKPASLTVSKGTIVKWVNKDSMPHTVTGGTFQSGMMQQGDFFTYQFDKAGTFPYACKIHPSMKGNIIVK